MTKGHMALVHKRDGNGLKGSGLRELSAKYRENTDNANGARSKLQARFGG
jgi:hypothetical protein